MTNVFDPTALERLDGFESDGRPLVSVLYDEFSVGARVDLEKLKAAAVAGRPRDVKHHAHSLKSAGRTLGLVRFGDVCERLERETDDGEMRSLAAELESLYSTGLKWLGDQIGAGT